jgi:hypothetical protein
MAAGGKSTPTLQEAIEAEKAREKQRWQDVDLGLRTNPDAPSIYEQ